MQNKETKKTASAHKPTQKSAWPYILISVFIVAALIAGFVMIKNHANRVTYRTVKIANTEYKLEVADTATVREKGLSERDSIPENGGMLFDFKAYGDWQMWMQQMRFPLDIAWLDSSGRIVYIKANAQPGDYPEVYHPNQPSWYAVEVAAGTFEKLGVKTGDTISL